MFPTLYADVVARKKSSSSGGTGTGASEVPPSLFAHPSVNNVSLLFEHAQVLRVWVQHEHRRRAEGASTLQADLLEMKTRIHKCSVQLHSIWLRHGVPTAWCYPGCLCAVSRKICETRQK